jgi:coproporphyrinogen III oxidase
MKTKSEILEDFGCPVPDFHENVTMFYPAIHSAMEEYAKQTAIEFAEWCETNGFMFYTLMFKNGVKGVWFNMKENDEGYTTSELFAKFEAERNQQQSELTCPECLSNRILEWPDKYQCRKCEHVWERSAK